MLLGVVLAVLLGVLAMHQLSHPAPTGHLMGTAATAMERQQLDPVAAVGMAQLEASSASPQHDGGAGGCLSCGDHPVVMALCVLALALLVLGWRLPRPWSRLVPPPGRRPRPSRPAKVRRLPALTLVELSVSRT